MTNDNSNCKAAVGYVCNKEWKLRYDNINIANKLYSYATIT
jgi:hypothetical protein